MSFPGAMRPPTHAPVDLTRLLRLGGELEEAAPAGVLTAEIIEDVAQSQGAPRSHVYAAAAVATQLGFERRHPVALVVCAGNCQQWGALEGLEQILQLRERRLADGKPAFDVRTRPCLDRCDFSPMVALETKDGVAAIPFANREKVAAAVSAVLDEDS
jgi:NADH:ubiquinone oxidoreductase subunit E